MMTGRQLIVPILVALAAGCRATSSNATQNNDADVKAIDAVREHEISVFKAGALDSLGAVYGDDVDVMPPGEPAVQGFAAARQWAETMFAQMTLAGNYTSSRVTVSGDWAIDRYTANLSSTPKSGGAAMVETIKGVHILKRQPNGTWKIVLDTWNSDKPETPPAPAPAGAKKDASKKK